jgi:serine/threonine protein kinase
MTVIYVRSAESTGLTAEFDAIKCIEIDDEPLGQGAFGAVYRVLLIDGRRPSSPQVIKVLFDNNTGNAQRGYATIRELQRRLRMKNTESLATCRRPLLDLYPALAGVPQFSFAGSLNGRDVLGYSANDLTSAGMKDFGHILDDDRAICLFQSLPISSRLALAYQLVSAFEFLSSQIRYIHADIKAEALFVGMMPPHCAIIDFDSGALAVNPDDKPTTFGTRQDWLAPEIIDQLDAAGNGTRLIKVDLLSDVWSVNVGIHYLLFGCHPLFFLTEISQRSMKAYFARHKWPDVDRRFKFFRADYASAYNCYIDLLQKTIPADVIARLEFTITRGFYDPGKRTTYGQWRTILTDVTRPGIRYFKADRDTVSDRRPVRLSWDIQGADRVEIAGIGDVSNRSWLDVPVAEDTTFRLILTPAHGNVITAIARVAVSKTPPTILFFRADSVVLSELRPVTLSWGVTPEADTVYIAGIGKVPRSGSVTITPTRDAEYRLRAASCFGVISEERLIIRVSKHKPRVEYFQVTPCFVTPGKPVTVRWKVSGATAVAIEPDIGSVPLEGTRVLDIGKNTDFVLTAETCFGVRATTRAAVRAPIASTLDNSGSSYLPNTALTEARSQLRLRRRG